MVGVYIWLVSIWLDDLPQPSAEYFRVHPSLLGVVQMNTLDGGTRAMFDPIQATVCLPERKMIAGS